MAGSTKTIGKVTNPAYCLSTAVSDFVLMLTCVFGKRSQFTCNSLPHASGIWKMFLANWQNFNKVFLHGYIWFGFCGAAAALGVFRFGLDKHFHNDKFDS